MIEALIAFLALMALVALLKVSPKTHEMNEASRERDELARNGNFVAAEEAQGRADRAAGDSAWWVGLVVVLFVIACAWIAMIGFG